MVLGHRWRTAQTVEVAFVAKCILQTTSFLGIKGCIGKTIVHKGVKIHGPENVPSMVGNHASELYSKNLQNFLELLINEEGINIDLEDEIITESLITHGGEIYHPKIKEQITGASS